MTPTYRVLWKGAFRCQTVFGDAYDPDDRFHIGKSKWTFSSVIGPIFPFFLEADLSTYEGFRKLIEKVGLNGLTFLDDETDYTYPIGKELEEVLFQEKTDLPDSFIEKFYGRVQRRLIEEQVAMKTFHQWFVEGRRPSKVSSEPSKRVLSIVDRHLSRIKIGLRIHENNPFKDKLLQVAKKEILGILKGEITPINALGKHINIKNEKTLFKISRKVISYDFGYDSLPAFCYMEMLDLVRDEVELRECAHCGETFIPEDERQEFCKRPAPGYSYAMPRFRTCQRVGTEKRHEKNNAAYRKEYKKFRGKLAYLKRKAGKEKEYRKVLLEFQQWEKEAKHGKKRG